MLRLFNLLISAWLFLCCSQAQAARPAAGLVHADALFEAQQYVEALAVYDSLLTTQQYGSQRMLGRMAFVEESLGRPEKALYYLNLYYSRRPDTRILEKMQDMARQNSLQGYVFNDTEYLLMLYNRYYYYVVLGLLLLAGVFAFFIFKNKDNRPLARGRGIGFLLTLLSCSAVVNYGQFYSRAIITDGPALIMDGPSAAASLLYKLKPGHRLPVKDQNGVWIESEWQNQTVYIHESVVSRVN